MLRGRFVCVTVLLAAGALLVSSCDWAQFRFGPDGTGFNPFETTIGASNVAGLQRRWSEKSRVPSFESSPVVTDGAVYISSSDGRLDAFDAATGTAKWSFDKGSAVTFGSSIPSPTVAAGVVYDLAGDGTLYAINAKTGSKVWSNHTAMKDIHYGSSLVVADGTVYVPDAALLFAFDASTGATLWSSNAVDVAGTGVPAVANGVIYTTPRGFARQLAQNATTGAALWSAHTTDVGGGSSPAVANGVVYTSEPEKLSAFDAKTGVPLWSATTDGCGSCTYFHPLASPAVANGVVYQSAQDGTLNAFNADTGARLWSTSTGAASASSSVVANGVVYVGDANGNLDAFSVTSGAELWSASAPGTSALPVVDDGVVYAASNDANVGVGQLVAYGLPVPTAELNMSPAFAPDYGTVLDGTSTPPTTFTVTNFGSATSSTITDTLSGADASQYRMTSDRCTGRTLAGNASCTIEVAFRPTIPGVRRATLAVHAATGGSASASLTGVGNALAITPAAKDYGAVLDGTRSPATTFTVTNVSTITVSPSVASLFWTQFTATSDRCTGVSLAAAATCTVGVAFTPTALGPTSATLSVSTQGVTTTADLSGTPQAVAIVPGSKNYGTVPVGSRSPATFTITNVNAATSFDLIPSAVSGTGFGITSDDCNGTTLYAGASCTVVVTFTPTISGATYAGELDVRTTYIGTINQATLVGKGG